MTKPTSKARFDELIHAPLRLRICASLAPVDRAEFSHLKQNLGVADSVLSKHLKQLGDAGYVDIERFTKLGRSHVRVSLTTAGRRAYVGHVAALREITAN